MVNLAFLLPKLSHGRDIVLVCLCPLNLITLGILLGESYYNWHLYAGGLICLEGPPTATISHASLFAKGNNRSERSSVSTPTREGDTIKKSSPLIAGSAHQG
jgi:hypothetical protein